MGETLETRRLSDAARGRPARRLAARFDLKRFLADESGATAVEYGILIGVLSLALVTIFGNAQAALIRVITDAAAKVESAVN
ncbi:MAG TPA: Flp family type IVb pilin [Phenylobacterium sp.]|nr:Flp family type IVb pilin [Phenylobacterium sp.]